jgi:REP element-mobilizing transposase RayT
MRTRKNIRLIGYDYSQDGVDFVTICSRERENIFARIGVGAPLGTQIYLLWTCARTHDDQHSTNSTQKKRIELTEIGNIIKKHLNEIPNQFDSVSLDEFIVMPNHLLGMIQIMPSRCRGLINQTPTPEQIPATKYKNGTPLGEIIRQFKAKSTHIIRYFSQIYQIWQRNYYEHIIRDAKKLKFINTSIIENPN